MQYISFAPTGAGALHLNVFTDPWIKCGLANGNTALYGIRDCLLHAAEIKEVSIPHPGNSKNHQNNIYMDDITPFVLMEMLLVRVFSPASEDDKLDMWENGGFDVAAVDRYVADCESRGISFDVFDEAHPFLQTSTELLESVDARRKPLGMIQPTISAGHSLSFYNCEFGANGEAPESVQSLSPAEYTAALTRNQMIRTAGGAGYIPSGSVAGEPPLFILTMGRNLFETLLFSMHVEPSAEIREKDRPMWEWDQYSEPVSKMLSEHRFGYLASTLNPVVYLHYGEIRDGLIRNVYLEPIRFDGEDKPQNHNEDFWQAATNYATSLRADKTRRYYDCDEGFPDALVRSLCGGQIIRSGEYSLCDKEPTSGRQRQNDEGIGSYFDAILPGEENISYYLYYVAGGHGFHHPILKSEVPAYKEKYRIPIIDIGTINSRGQKESDLVPMEFVDAVLRLVDSGEFVYKEDPYGDDESWFDTDYKPELSEEEAWENILGALDSGWGVVLSEIVSPIVFGALPPETLDISRGEQEKEQTEKLEAKRMRSSAKGKCKEIQQNLEACRKQEASSQTMDDLLAVRKSLRKMEKQFSFVVKKPKASFENDLIWHVLWNGNDPECCTYGFSSVQELAEYMIELIDGCGMLLPNELHQIELDYYAAHWQEIWQQESCGLKRTWETLLSRIESKIQELSSAHTEKGML